MAKTTEARPAKKPARASVVDDGEALLKPKGAGRSKPKPSGLPGPKAPTVSANRAVGNVARKKTIKATTAIPNCTTAVVVDPGDQVALEKVAKAGAVAIESAADPQSESAAALMARVTRAVERQLLQIETILGSDRSKTQQQTEAERRARTLASLARTLSEVRRLRATDESSAYVPSAARDLDAFRKTLWQRLEQALSRRADARDGADDTAGDAGPR